MESLKEGVDVVEWSSWKTTSESLEFGHKHLKKCSLRGVVEMEAQLREGKWALSNSQSFYGVGE